MHALCVYGCISECSGILSCIMSESKADYYETWAEQKTDI